MALKHHSVDEKLIFLGKCFLSIVYFILLGSNRNW